MLVPKVLKKKKLFMYLMENGKVFNKYRDKMRNDN